METQNHNHHHNYNKHGRRSKRQAREKKEARTKRYKLECGRAKGCAVLPVHPHLAGGGWGVYREDRTAVYRESFLGGPRPLTLLLSTLFPPPAPPAAAVTLLGSRRPHVA